MVRGLREGLEATPWRELMASDVGAVTFPTRLAKPAVPVWLKNVRAGIRWHRTEQGRLDGFGGYSEVYIAKPNGADGVRPVGYNRLDPYNANRLQIRSMK